MFLLLQMLLMQVVDEALCLLPMLLSESRNLLLVQNSGLHLSGLDRVLGMEQRRSIRVVHLVMENLVDRAGGAAWRTFFPIGVL